MLALRVVPCLDVDAGRVVKGVRYAGLRDAGDPVELARRYDAEGADELVFYDITASSDARDIILDVVTAAAEQVFVPLTVGGGIRTVADARRILAAGADKVSFNNAMVERPHVLAEAAAACGSQSVVASIDARRRSRSADDGWQVCIHGGRTVTGLDAVAWAAECERLGAGELVLNSIDRDGGRAGFDLELLQAVGAAVNLPVIASGGAGGVAHMVEGLVLGGASGVLAASIFHYGEVSIAEVKEAIAQAGLPVRRSPVRAPAISPSPFARHDFGLTARRP